MYMFFFLYGKRGGGRYPIYSRIANRSFARGRQEVKLWIYMFMIACLTSLIPVSVINNVWRLQMNSHSFARNRD